MEKFSLEKAREEADRMSEKIKAGQANNYPEAEKQLELEKGELAPVLVPVEQLILGIKADEKIGLSFEERKDSGYDLQTGYATELPRAVYWAFVHDGPNKNRLLRNGFKDQVVVDLGAGNMNGYLAAMEGRASGYVGVDKFTDLTGFYKDPKFVRESADKRGSTKEKALIPVATVQEDMLIFLRRLPDNSVSIISSGLTFLIENEIYVDEVKKEMGRVLSPNGFLVVNEGITITDDTIAKRVYHGDIDVFLKVDEERDQKSAEEDRLFIEQINNETDVGKLQARYTRGSNTLSGEEKETFERLKIIKKRIEQLKERST